MTERKPTRRRGRAAAYATLFAAVATVGAVRAQQHTGHALPPAENENRFGIACWLPYWKKAEGARAVLQHLDLFEQVSPFSFRVQNDGTLRDMLKITRAPWPQLLKAARRRGVAVIPTLVWSRASERAAALGYAKSRDKHIKHIIDLVLAHGLDGVDIDYERKTPAEREDFSRFLTDLSRRLHQQGRKLSCTVEPRTADAPPAGLSGQRASPWANDYGVLNRVCDQVRLMAYDQWSMQAAGHGRQRQRPPSHAGLPWIEQVVRYTVSRIDPRRLYLGIPTYGWEFAEQNRGDRTVYRRVGARSFIEFADLVRSRRLVTERDPGGELRARHGRRLLVMSDAQAIEKRIELAKRHGLRGVVLFKMDGQEDPDLWRVLRQSQRAPAGSCAFSDK